MLLSQVLCSWLKEGSDSLKFSRFVHKNSSPLLNIPSKFRVVLYRKPLGAFNGCRRASISGGCRRSTQKTIEIWRAVRITFCPANPLLPPLQHLCCFCLWYWNCSKTVLRLFLIFTFKDFVTFFELDSFFLLFVDLGHVEGENNSRRKR